VSIEVSKGHLGVCLKRRSRIHLWLYEAGKRIGDCLFSSLALLVCSPFAIIIAIAIKLDSAGPIFFFQRRVGRRGVPFHMIKFRSMYTNAELLRASLVHRREERGPTFKLADDPRVTRVGRFLRRTSIDELPQFLNVLLGQMSLVGPRPLPAQDVEDWYEKEPTLARSDIVEWLEQRQQVRPGITGLWQVRGRSLLSLQDWIRYDLEYVGNRGLVVDAKILALTPVVVVLGRGAM